MLALTDLVQKFEASEQASLTARSESEKSRDYYDGRQLTSAEIQALKKRRQPLVIENLIRPKVDYMCGLERQNRTDPKAWPRTMQHEQDASAATDAMRYVADDQFLDVKRSSVFQNMLIEGFGGVEIGVEETRAGIDPVVKYVSWDRLFYDPHSAEADFSDASYLGYVNWMDVADAKARWPQAKDIIEQTIETPTSTYSETYDDKPKWTFWSDDQRNRIRVVTIYCKQGDGWYKAIYTLAGEIVPYGPSAYLDENGKPECALVMQSAFVDRDNDRYGTVRDYITLQDEVNKRRSKFLHLSNSRQIRVSRSANLSKEQARSELARPDGAIVADQGEVEIIGTGDMASGHFNLLAEAKSAIQAVGPNATMQGKASADSSGKAILALQQGGMTEMAPLLDNLRHFNIRVFRMIWNRIRQYWTAERWIRVTDDEKNVRFVGLNVTKGHLAALKLKAANDAGEIDDVTAQQYLTQIQADPQMQTPANNVAEMDVDIQIDEAVDSPSLQIEQFDQLTRLAPMTPPQYLPTMFELLIEASSLKNKDRLREIIELGQQAPDPAEQEAVQIAAAAEQAKIEKTQSETARNMATAEATTAGVQLDAIKAGLSVAA